MKKGDVRRGVARLVLVAGLLLVGSGALARTKLNAGSVTLNGQTVRALSCEFAKGGAGSVVKVVAALAKQKKALDACAPGGAAFRVQWSWDGGAVTDAKVQEASDAQAAECVARALRLTKSADQGECQATVLVGQGAAAAKAADGLGKGEAK